MQALQKMENDSFFLQISLNDKQYRKQAQDVSVKVNAGSLC